MPVTPNIPEYITVHLGRPNEAAQNVTVTFPDYIKNVASSEIYPTWPREAIIANIYAQISFALNRIFTDWYPSQGYDFDITSTTAYDQSFVNGRNVFENISDIVDEIFNSYVRRQGNLEPLFTSYCSGRGTNCAGLKQWDTVDLAEQGYSALDILKYYYGDDIEIVTSVPVRISAGSYQGSPLRLGDAGPSVQTLQNMLNRVSRNYPAILTVSNSQGIFNLETETAVKKFQQIFNLTPDGIVGNATWYRLAYIYVSIKRLSELNSEGLSLSDVPQQYVDTISLGSTGRDVQVVQYYLAVIGRYYDTVPVVATDGIFGEQTEAAVRAFQQTLGLPVDGIVGAVTWNAINRAYRGIIGNQAADPNRAAFFPGVILQRGMSGESVRLLQTYLSRIADDYPAIPKITPDGIFGAATEAAVRAYQTEFGLQPNGIVGAVTWDSIGSLYDDLGGSV